MINLLQNFQGPKIIWTLWTHEKKNTMNNHINYKSMKLKVYKSFLGKYI